MKILSDFCFVIVYKAKVRTQHNASLLKMLVFENLAIWKALHILYKKVGK